ncbi:AI-2E family transporter [Nordella sp. HKS 07]|uniref:AI-2E family transporter n=1 Tax=Nordella sp. HKS 07 TaxID=2712222 RepID=UPI0013E18968|nr:AI-2E family transporter [Nordella sp. HKS 07]QIG49417.1 AI-2E family transporter [Nordella sp. HKS 07]
MERTKAPNKLPQLQLLDELDSRLRSIRVALLGIFLILLVGLVYFARDFLLPVILALLLALTLSPIVRFMQKRGVAPPISALFIVLIVLGIFCAGIFFLSGPVTEWVSQAPEISRKIQYKLASLRSPVNAVVQASEQVGHIADSTSADDVQKVAIQQPGMLSTAAASAFGGITTAGVTFVLLLFLLSSGTMFYQKLVSILPSLRDKKRALAIAYDVEREVSQYLATITLINCGFGAAVAIAMAVTGMPNPVMWGVAAALLNFVPYIGALAGIVMVGIVALISFDSVAYAVIPPLLYAACAFAEGQLVTPILLGRRLELNSVAIFICVALWSWLWGIVGAIIAVPLLVAVKVFCDHFEPLGSFGEFLSGSPVSIAVEESKDRNNSGD